MILKKKREIFASSSTFSLLRKTSEYNWAEGFSQVLAHKMCTLEITKIHLLKSHTWKVLTENTWAGLMLFSLTKSGLQPLFRALFFPSEAKGTVWSLCRETPVLATDDRAADSSLLFTCPASRAGVGFTGFPGEAGSVTGLCKNWQSSPWTVQLGRSWQLWERSSELEFVMPKGA